MKTLHLRTAPARWALWCLLFLAATACAALPEPGEPGAPADARYVGEPERDRHGRIKRSQTPLRRFVQAYPCPSTGQRLTSCPGWRLDHVIPLACGGADLPFNLQWLPTQIKSAAGTLPKDRWERRVYCPRS